MAENKLIDPKEAGKLVSKYWDNYYRSVLQKLIPDWQNLYKKYRSYPDFREDLQESNLFIPRTFDSVETALPRLLLAIFSANPPFQALPRSSDDVENAKKITEIITYYNDRTNFFQTVYKAIKITSIYGTSVIKTMWDASKQEPVRHVIHLQDFLIDPTASCIEEAEYAGDRHIRSLTYLREMERRGFYNNINDVEKNGTAYSADKDDNFNQTKGMFSNENPYQKSINEKEKYYEVIECYINNKTQVTTIAGGITIRNDKNELVGGDDYPYAPVYITPDVMEFYGIGIAEPIKHLQEELNDFNNAIMTRLNRSVTPITLASASEWENVDTWKFGSGEVWKVNDIVNGMKFETLPPLPPEFFGVVASLNSNIDKTNALGDYVRGVANGGESATGASILAQAADSRLKLQVYTIQNCLKRAIRLDIKNIQNFMPQKLAVRILGTEGFTEYDRDSVQGERDIIAAGTAEIVSKDAKRSQLVNLMNILFRPEVYAKMVQEGYMLQLNQIIRQIFETYEMKDLASMITKLPPVPTQPSQTPSMAPMGGEQQTADIGTPVDMQEALKQVAETQAPGQTLPM